jgi:beta-fructofuranosidase
MMECPNLFTLGGKWLLCVSPCAPVIYAMGAFANHRFHPETEWLPMDLGGRDDFYAPNSMLDAQGRRIQWGWVRVGPRGASWNGVLTLPRILSLRTDGQLGIEPLPELSRLRGHHERWEDIALAADAPACLTHLRSDTVEICAELELGSARELELRLGRSSAGRSQLALTYDREAGRLHCGQRFGAFRVLPGENGLQLNIFLDRSVMEVYVNGRVALTAGGDRLGSQGEAPGGEGERAVTLLARGGRARASAVDVWEMRSIWGAQQHETGDSSPTPRDRT